MTERMCGAHAEGCRRGVGGGGGRGVKKKKSSNLWSGKAAQGQAGRSRRMSTTKRQVERARSFSPHHFRNER